MASRSGKNCLSYQIIDAALTGNLRRIKKLAKELGNEKEIPEAMAHIRDSAGRGVLHAAAVKGRTNVCRYLLEELKLPVDEKDEEDCTPLLHASLEGSLSTVEYLIENGANPVAINKHNTTALHLAVLEGNNDVVHFLLSKGADANAPSTIGTPLQIAAQVCDLSLLKILLDNGAAPNLENLIPTPLDFCVPRSLECTKLLIQVFASKYEATVQQPILADSNITIIAGADPNGTSWGSTPLASAAKKGGTEFIKFLLEAGADPNITDDIGLKPIEIAARNGKHQEAEILFPATSPIPACAEWSISGIMKHVHSKEIVEHVTFRLKEKHSKAMSNGEDALQGKDYPRAAFYYTQAIASDPSDATALSKRSYCLSCLGDGCSAWADAKACIALNPDWPEAYYRGGIALSLLGMLETAADTFLMGLKLDPDNKGLQEAYQGVAKAKRKMHRIQI